jgi:hypothetical protein
MKTTKFFILVALITGLFVSSCSKESVGVPVPIPDFTIKFSSTLGELETSALRSDNDFKPFFGTGTITIDDKDFKNLKSNLDNIILSSLKIGSVSVKVTGLVGVSVKGVVFSSPGVSDFEAGDYTVGGDYQTNPALVSYATTLFLKFINDGQLTISVKGYTDAEVDEDFTTNLSFEDVEIKAKVL